MNMMAVPFHGESLYVVNHNGEPYVPMKPCRWRGWGWPGNHSG